MTVSLVVVGLQGRDQSRRCLTFEPSIEIVEATAGSLLTLDGTPVGTERAFEAGRARVKLTKATPTSGSGAVLSLRLRGVAPGQTPRGRVVVGVRGGSREVGLGVDEPSRRESVRSLFMRNASPSSCPARREPAHLQSGHHDGPRRVEPFNVHQPGHHLGQRRSLGGHSLRDRARRYRRGRRHGRAVLHYSRHDRRAGQDQ